MRDTTPDQFRLHGWIVTRDTALFKQVEPRQLTRIAYALFDEILDSADDLRWNSSNHSTLGHILGDHGTRCTTALGPMVTLGMMRHGGQ